MLMSSSWSTTIQGGTALVDRRPQPDEAAARPRSWGPSGCSTANSVDVATASARCSRLGLEHELQWSLARARTLWGEECYARTCAEGQALTLKATVRQVLFVVRGRVLSPTSAAPVLC